MKQFSTFILLLLFSINIANAGIKITPRVYVISIGIDKYPAPHALQYCVKDSRAFLEKLSLDSKNYQDEYDWGYENKVVPFDFSDHEEKYDRHIYLLSNENASLDSIRSTLKEIIKRALPWDYFIFYFAGISWEVNGGETVLIPYTSDSLDFILKADLMLKLYELAQLLEQVQCEKQLIITEAGNGSAFAGNLVSELFESNPLLAAGSDRNRVIITTKRWGMESNEWQHGWLTYFITNSANLFDAFENPLQYEFALSKTEASLHKGKEKYIAIYSEKDYRNIFLKAFKKKNSRGIDMEEEPGKSESKGKTESKTYALLIANNNYSPESGWENLRNPVNDAEAVAGILQSKYHVEVHKYYNKPKDSILTKILKIKSQMDENDKFIFFIAGHGYYSNDFSDGYLVFPSSESPSKDITLQSYLQMASLNRILDNMPSKQLFVIFDVCFGASFDLNSKDIALSDYQNSKMDISLEKFIERKDEHSSRIFLASGRYEVPDYWSNSLSHSPFAAKLIEVFQNEEQFISPGKIFTHLEGNVTEPFLKQFGKHEPRGDFLLQVKN